MKKNKGFVFCRDAGILIIASLARCISVYVFTVPNQFAPGGVTGIASILYNTPLEVSVGLTIFVLNIPLLVLAYFKMNKSFALKTAFVIALLSVGVELFERAGLPQYTTGSGGGADKMLAAVFGGLFTGVSLALTFKVNASSGGTDVIGALIQKRYSATNVAWFILALDSVVVIVGGIVLKQFEPVMYSFVSMFVGSKVSETIARGFTTAVTYTVITEKPDELSKKIIERVHRGVTLIPCVGAYTGAQKTMLQCVVRRRQVTDFHRLLKELDKNAFAFAMPATEVLGRGFTIPLIDEDGKPDKDKK
ncbi:MAG: YitT family protein [Clostridiales bacterium]|jgi:uncharacterized membrane-anchored protein YitT (DUF2179 family)|nr:YitT family protein [Clostridiales bacterium]